MHSSCHYPKYLFRLMQIVKLPFWIKLSLNSWTLLMQPCTPSNPLDISMINIKVCPNSFPSDTMNTILRLIYQEAALREVACLMEWGKGWDKTHAMPFLPTSWMRIAGTQSNKRKTNGEGFGGLVTTLGASSQPTIQYTVAQRSNV